MKLALIAENEDGRIVEFRELGNPFPVSPPLRWRVVPDDVTNDHKWEGNAPVAPPVESRQPVPKTEDERVLEALKTLQTSGAIAGLTFNPE